MKLATGAEAQPGDRKCLGSKYTFQVFQERSGLVKIGTDPRTGESVSVHQEGALGHMTVPSGSERETADLPDVERILFEIRGLIMPEAEKAEQLTNQMLGQEKEPDIEIMRRTLLAQLGRAAEQVTRTKKFAVWPEFFEKIRSGEKTIELRPAYHKLRYLRPGDRLVFENQESGETIEAEIKEVTQRKDINCQSKLEELCWSELGSKIAPGKSPDEILRSAKRIFNKGKLARFGVLLISFELVP